MKTYPQIGSPEWHRLEIAKATVKMSPVGAMIMGSMTILEAEQLLEEYGIKTKENIDGNKSISKESRS